MNKNSMPFAKINYILMLVGIGIITLGFFIISQDPEPHGFGFMGLTLGPIITLSGFIFGIYAIFHQSEKK